MNRTSHTVRRNIPAGIKSRQRKKSGIQEKIRLRQLLICLMLFLTVFIGKGIFPSKLIQVRDDIMALLTHNIDLRTAFSELGSSINESETIWEQLGEFCVEVFGAVPDSESPQKASYTIGPDGRSIGDVIFLSGGRQDPAQLSQRLFSEKLPNLKPPAKTEKNESSASESEQTQPEVVPTAGTLLIKADYNGQPLPNNYTMDKLALGDLQTVTPVLGHLNSVYGYRDHPINGKYQFHGGVDIGGQMGDPIKAFAAGRVEYVGKDDSYGLYLQLDHGNGVKSFYAHCSQICVVKGQSVASGEEIAKVGSSGAATGPHLHLELKYNKIHLDPTYYIEFLERG